MGIDLLSDTTARGHEQYGGLKMDEHRKIAEEIAIKHTEVKSENVVTLSSCRWLLSEDIANALRTTASKSEKDGYRIAAQEADSIKSHSTNHEDRRHTIHCYYADVGGAIRSLIREDGK